MNKGIKNILLIIIALAAACIYYIDIGIENNQLLQYLILFPALIVFGVYFYLYRKARPDFFLVFLMVFVIAAYFLKANKFGAQLSDLIPLGGFLAIPLMITVFIKLGKKDKDKILKYFIYFFSIVEVILLLLKLTYGDIIGFNDLSSIRAIFPSWPNYFAILASLKIGIILYLYRIKSIGRVSLIGLIFLSISTIFLSLSRTGILMIGIIISLNAILSLESLSLQTIFVKNRKKTILIFSILAAIALIFLIKGSFGDNSLSLTLFARFGVWEDVLPSIRNNLLIGLGFRSIIDSLGTIGEKFSTHNDFLDTLLKGGIIGFLLIYGYYLRRVWMLLKKNYHEFVSIILAIFTAGFFQNPLKDLSIMIIFTLLLSYSYKEVYK